MLARAALVALTVALLSIAAALGVRSFSQSQLAAATAIDSSNGIESLEAVAVRDDTQWIYARGHDLSNPVLLYLHGGPGMAEHPIARAGLVVSLVA